MEYQALYRTFRPGTFEAMVGQEHVVKTLTNALSSGRVGHAYLFCGPRGTGKTSAAKILAKALNCVHGPTPQPCDECDACKRIAKGYSMDVIEIDAASNRGINEIRDLREKVKFAPAEGRYKVYIIDEVHMLTTEAFNALLKTLEEPPPHVVFVLATTEPEEIPPTVLSRCQRFDFRSLPQGKIAAHVIHVANRSGATIDPEAADLIASRAMGGMRDALSVLEQCIAFGSSHVNAQVVREALGVSDITSIEDLVEALLGGNGPGAVAVIDSVCRDGRDIDVYLRDSLAYARDAYLAAMSGTQAVLGGETSARTWAYAPGELLALMSFLSDVMAHPLWAVDPRLALEVGCLTRNPELPQAVPTPTEPAARTAVAPTPAPAPAEQPVPTKLGAPERGESLSLDAIRGKWNEVLDAVKKEKISLRAFVVEGIPTSYQGGVLNLQFRSDFAFHRENLALPKNKAVVEAVVSRILGLPTTVSLSLEGADESVPSSAEASPTASGGGNDAAVASLDPTPAGELDPMVKEALRIFGGRLTRIDSEGEM